MFYYRSIETTLFTPDLGYFQTYGILAEQDCGNGRTAVLMVQDVSCNKNLVACLARNCTKGQLDPVHLMDVILDALP